MDDIKDTQKYIQKTDQLSQFFDNRTIRTNAFGANQSGDLAYRRAERIVAALHLVTKHVSSEEPLRISVRTEALLILGHLLSLRNQMRAVDSDEVGSCRASIRHLISLVRMLAVSGLLSIQNTNVVIESLDDLGTLLGAASNSTLSEAVVLSREGLAGIHGPIKDIKDNRIIKDRIRIKDTTIMSDTSAINEGLSVRGQGIMGILRVSGELGIRDIASNLPEYSEKMIQRDLVELVMAGRVRRVGLKRWSRYSVA